MSSERDRGEEFAKAVFGFTFHLFLATAGSFAFGMAITLGVDAIAPNAIRNFEIIPYMASSALVASYATPRWSGRSAPWVGIIGLVALGLGSQELIRYWGPTWSHQSRSDYVVSQLFCLGNSTCGSTEGLYALLFGWPFLCLASYSLASLVALRVTRKKRIP